MSCIYDGALTLAPQARRSQGATETQAREFMRSVPVAAHVPVQIHISKITMAPDLSRPQVLWQHDGWDDPHQCVHQQDWDLIVFVSHWQRQQYLDRWPDLPPSVVIENVTHAMPACEKPEDTLEFVYAAAPDRGLEILVSVFDRLYQLCDRLRLTIFTGFGLYGWPEQDEPHRAYWQVISEHPGIDFRGFEPDHAQVLAVKQRGHIWLYPTSWLENSCVSLMESLAAGMICVHPDRGALAETAAGRSRIYAWSAHAHEHSDRAFDAVRDVVLDWRDHGRLPAVPGPRIMPQHQPQRSSLAWQRVLANLVPRRISYDRP